MFVVVVVVCLFVCLSPVQPRGGGRQGDLPRPPCPLLLGEHPGHEPPPHPPRRGPPLPAGVPGGELPAPRPVHQAADHHHQDELHQAGEEGQDARQGWGE